MPEIHFQRQTPFAGRADVENAREKKHDYACKKKHNVVVKKTRRGNR